MCQKKSCYALIMQAVKSFAYEFFLFLFYFGFVFFGTQMQQKKEYRVSHSL